MEISINYLAVVAATAISIAIGFLWYGPLFGKQWMALMGITPESITEEKKKGMAKSYIFMTLGSFLMSYVLAHALIFASYYTQTFGIAAGLMAGLWNWLGFIAPVLLGSVLWEGKSWKLWILNAGYYLVSLILMAITLSLWK